MKNNKKMNALGRCICHKCPRRFYCFTNIKVFSDPVVQAIFEGYLFSNEVSSAVEWTIGFLKDHYSSDHQVWNKIVVSVKNAANIRK